MPTSSNARCIDDVADYSMKDKGLNLGGVYRSTLHCREWQSSKSYRAAMQDKAV